MELVYEAHVWLVLDLKALHSLSYKGTVLLLLLSFVFILLFIIIFLTQN